MRSPKLVQRLRIGWYRRRWTCASVTGSPRLISPVMLAGEGSIRFEGAVTLGWEQGPGFHSGYTYVEARHPESVVALGDGTHLNNGVTIVSEGPGISIGRRCLVGPGVHIYDSDFHALVAEDRATMPPRQAEVRIGDEVFIGSGAMILKGVNVGAGGVVGAGAVVSVDVPDGAVVAGNPAQVVRA
jgi:maltose O-acetyltransferase